MNPEMLYSSTTNLEVHICQDWMRLPCLLTVGYCIVPLSQQQAEFSVPPPTEVAPEDFPIRRLIEAQSQLIFLSRQQKAWVFVLD